VAKMHRVLCYCKPAASLSALTFQELSLKRKVATACEIVHLSAPDNWEEVAQ